MNSMKINDIGINYPMDFIDDLLYVNYDKKGNVTIDDLFPSPEDYQYWTNIESESLFGDHLFADFNLENCKEMNFGPSGTQKSEELSVSTNCMTNIRDESTNEPRLHLSKQNNVSFSISDSKVSEKPKKIEPELCKIRSQSFDSTRIHKKTRRRAKLHNCGKCNYASSEKSNLKRHLMTHSGERPFQCPFCSYSSAHFHILKSHSYTHAGKILKNNL